jgi:hypothetical protein
MLPAVFLLLAIFLLHGGHSSSFDTDAADPLILVGRQSSSSPFTAVGVPSDLSSIELVFQVVPANLASLNLTLYAGTSSGWDSSLGFNYLSSELLAAMTPNPAAVSTVVTWLNQHTDLVVTHKQGFLVNAYGPLPTWDRVLNATFLFYENTGAVMPSDRRRLIRCDAFYLPKSVADVVLTVYNTVNFPDIPETPTAAVPLNSTTAHNTTTPTAAAGAAAAPPALHAQSMASDADAHAHAHADAYAYSSAANQRRPDPVLQSDLPLPKVGYAKVVSMDGEGNTINVFYMQDGKVVPPERVAQHQQQAHSAQPVSTATAPVGLVHALLQSVYNWVASWYVGPRV